MMLTVLAAAAASLQPVATTPAPTDPDLRCMATYLVIGGQMDEDTKATAGDKAGVQSIVMYFFGKVYARQPQLDLKTGIRQLLESPEYLSTGLKADIERCSTEALERGKYLQSFGEGAEKPRSGGTSQPR